VLSARTGIFPAVLEALDEAAAGRWCRAAVEGLSRARAGIDELNVFPVPDGDTGTNLLLTVQAGLDALDALGRPDAGPDGGAEPAWAVLARGAVLGARGNSGAILSQLLRGLADQLAGHPPADGATLAAALQKAAETAYTAVADPAEGTLLTVARAGAEAAGTAVSAGRPALADVVRAAADGARAALEATPGQLAALRDAGVVDAGGAGFCVVLDALVAVVTGEEPAGAPLGRTRGPGRARGRVGAPPPGPGSEVQFLLAGSDETRVAALQERLAALGDSLVVVGVDTAAGREWNVHVHVEDVGAAVEAGIEAGRPYRVQVTPLAPALPPAVAEGTRAVVAVGAAPGLGALFAGEGATVLPAGPGGPPEDAVLAAVLGTGAAEVVVLPNDPAAAAPAARAAERARPHGRDVAVVPTRSPVQGLAALAVADPGRRFGDDVIAMAEAAAATRWAELAVAEQEALTTAGRCRPGDVLGIADGDVVVLGPDPAAVGRELLDRLLSAGGELATVVVGEDVALGEAVCAHLSRAHPTVEVTRLDGGPGAALLLVGVE
jgi:DAK2 domain fusion protein YloV